MSESSGSVKVFAFPRKASYHASYYANYSRKGLLILKGFHNQTESRLKQSASTASATQNKYSAGTKIWEMHTLSCLQRTLLCHLSPFPNFLT